MALSYARGITRNTLWQTAVPKQLQVGTPVRGRPCSAQVKGREVRADVQDMARNQIASMLGITKGGQLRKGGCAEAGWGGQAHCPAKSPQHPPCLSSRPSGTMQVHTHAHV